MVAVFSGLIPECKARSKKGSGREACGYGNNSNRTISNSDCNPLKICAPGTVGIAIGDVQNTTQDALHDWKGSPVQTQPVTQAGVMGAVIRGRGSHSGWQVSEWREG